MHLESNQVTPVRPWIQSTPGKDSTRLSVHLWYHYRSTMCVQQYFHLSWVSISHTFVHMCAKRVSSNTSVEKHLLQCNCLGCISVHTLQEAYIYFRYKTGILLLHVTNRQSISNTWTAAPSPFHTRKKHKTSKRCIPLQSVLVITNIVFDDNFDLDPSA